MKKIKKIERPWMRVVGFFGLGILTGLVLVVGVARLTWHSKYYPGLKIAGVEVAGLSREQAREKLIEATSSYQPSFSFNGAEWTAPQGAVEYELETTLNEVYSYGRRLKIGDYLLLIINKQTNFPLHLAEGQTEMMEALISDIASTVEIHPIDPEIVVDGKTVKVIQGTDGTVISGQQLSEQIQRKYSQLSESPIEIPVVSAKRIIDEEMLRILKSRGEKLLGSKLVLVLDDERVLLSGEKLVSTLSTGGESILNSPTLTEYVVGLGDSLNTDPQDAKFEFVDGKVVEFAPGRDGVEVSVAPTVDSIQRSIEALVEDTETSATVEIVVTRTPPQVTTDKVNELGIRERIGRGESYYAHSIANRIYNVGLASERVNSALVAPGEEYSFNKVIGEISGATGYRTAYVISGGRTVLGDGGGVCQVSTTVFRAAMNAGLPITERWAHAYRVGYYEQNSKAGLDATIYSPSKDLKFLNDTPGHILVQTINDPKTQYLVVEIYGTDDGRVASVSEPKVWGVTPPPPDIYQDDPSLPTGSVKQVDWSAWGARASFDYKVERDGLVLQEKTFSSAYRPWANVYLRGTGE